MIWYVYIYSIYIYINMIYVFDSLVHNFAPNPPNICVCATELLSSKFLNPCKTKEEQIPGPVLWELYTAPWWLQWNLHKKLRYFLETFLASSCKEKSLNIHFTFSIAKPDVPSKSWNLNCSDPRNVPAWLENCNLENLEPNPMHRPRR